MSQPRAKIIANNETVAENRRARFDYFIEETFDAGIVLTGTEVKSLRRGQCSLNEAHADLRDGAVYLVNVQIAEYPQAGRHLQHEPKRPRKLLLHQKEINKLIGAVTRDGYTLVPLKIYFNARGLAKAQLAIAKGKKLHDKRATEKARDWGREKQKLLRDKG